MKKIDSKTIHPAIKTLLSYATSESKIEQEYDKYMQSVNRKLYAFEINGALVGCIGIEFLAFDKCEIKHIAVSPSKRGNGIGSKLIQFVCDKYSLRQLNAETDKDAVEFYRNYGFKITNLGEKYSGDVRFLCELNIS